MWIWQLQPLILLIISLSVCISRSNAFICNCNKLSTYDRKMSLDPAVDGWEDKYIEQGGDKDGEVGPNILSLEFDVHAASDTELTGKRDLYCNVHMMCTFI